MLFRRYFSPLVALACSIALSIITIIPPTVPTDWARLDANGIYTPPLINYAWPEYGVQLALWLLMLLAISSRLSPRHHPRSAGKSTGYPVFTLLLASLTLLGFGLRLHTLDNLPLIIDEIGFAAHASDILHGQQVPVFAPGHNEFTSLYSWLMAGSMGLFGQNRFAMRLVTLAFGTLSIPAVYLLGRVWFSRGLGLGAAAFLATWPAHIFFSRMALNNLADPLFAMLALTSLDLAFKKRPFQRQYCVMAGVWAGLAQYFYSGSRLLLALLVIYAVFMCIREKPDSEGQSFRGAEKSKSLPSSVRWFLQTMLLAFFGFGVVALPRFAPVFAGQTPVLGYSTPGLPADAGANALRSLLAWAGQPDVSPFWLSDAPLLEWPVLLVLGVGILIALYRHRLKPMATSKSSPLKGLENDFPAKSTSGKKECPIHVMVLGVWVALVTIFGGVVWPAAPLYVRYMTAAPAVALLVSAGVRLSANSRRLQRKAFKPGWCLMLTLICVQAIYAAILHIDEAQSRISPGQWEADRLAQEAAALSHSVPLNFIVSEAFGEVDAITIAHQVAAYGARRAVRIERLND